jgi:hypothetical protein
MTKNDPFFGPPYVDADEWLDEPERHRRVHGGFLGTDTRFSFYFPPPSVYRGRFLHWLEGGPGGHETVAARLLDFPFAQGAYVVESNQGHLGTDPGPPNPTITNYRASEATARYAAEMATEMYGSPPHHGYMWGGSGGGFRTISGLENVGDVWDGGVPFVSGSRSGMGGGTHTHMGSVQGEVMRRLGDKLADAVEAFEPGGSGDPYIGLDPQQRDALAALLEGGYQSGALFELNRPSVATLLMSSFGISMMRSADPQFFEDFWTVPGYAGADGDLAEDLIDDKAVVSRVMRLDELEAANLMDPALAMANSVAPSLEMSPVGISLDRQPPTRSRYAAIRLLSGKGAGQELTCFGTRGDVLVASATGAELASSVAPGDEVLISNRDWLAYCSYHRYVGERGAALADPRLRRSGGRLAVELPESGRFAGRIILVNGTLDSGVILSALIYDRLVRDQFGEEADVRFRLWWTDNASHVPGSALAPGPIPVTTTRLVDYMGINQQAMMDLIEWVEHDRPPASSTSFTYEDGQLRLPDDAGERLGLQPVVSATVDGSPASRVTAGEPVTFAVVAETPPNAGTIISAEWDFDGTGTWPYHHEGIDGSAHRVELAVQHVFDRPGVYYPAVRVRSHRHGDLDARFGRIENLDRVRVVVT